jgi:hypothetical protein
MRLKLLLPVVEPQKYEKPRKCPRKGCCGMRFKPRQAVDKKIVDAQHRAITAWRYEFVKCGTTFRVYPQGGSKKQISKRVKGMAVMLYVLGLSYGAVEMVLSSLGVSIGKASVYRRTWKDEDGNLNLDGTNNHCERSIGWWIKERYRSMRGYKREQSSLNFYQF